MRLTIILILFSLGFIHCDFEREHQKKQQDPEYIGGGYTCNTGTGEGFSDIKITIERLVPAEAEIQCTDRKIFSLEERDISFVYVAYGELRDCISGCFTSFLCGIYDPDESSLYSFTWYDLDEKPLSIPPDCPELVNAQKGNTSRCTTPPRGASHPLTTTMEFVNFKSTQRTEHEIWRFCF